MNTNRTPISTASPFDLDSVKAHARVDGDFEDWTIAQMADAAAREIEAHCGLALLAQAITVTLSSWCCRIPLPIGPFWTAGLTDHPITLELIDEAGNVTPHPAGWRIEGGRYPVISLTSTGQGQHLRITYPAGFGMEASSIPADLALAICDQAAAFYDQRGAEDARQGLSVAASRIAARHRRVAV
ncbi:head-tail connector protein [Paracoccus spongiarum]|uniref:Phage gp6-like head-tail connector protein n=1 Tax=Paracoccus spongiarum TaxID=3064387 RepID=A0ABT9JH51_9RHOB|nr:hypothetical protein [Paracoccus sp. 2205BS29-5]MDP5309142.1 hypothetical protein [Paracoccus sp. 2205BS29-5]